MDKREVVINFLVRSARKSDGFCAALWQEWHREEALPLAVDVDPVSDDDDDDDAMDVDHPRGEKRGRQEEEEDLERDAKRVRTAIDRVYDAMVAARPRAWTEALTWADLPGEVQRIPVQGLVAEAKSGNDLARFAVMQLLRVDKATRALVGTFRVRERSTWRCMGAIGSTSLVVPYVMNNKLTDAMYGNLHVLFYEAFRLHHYDFIGMLLSMLRRADNGGGLGALEQAYLVAGLLAPDMSILEDGERYFFTPDYHAKTVRRYWHQLMEKPADFVNVMRRFSGSLGGFHVPMLAAKMRWLTARGYAKAPAMALITAAAWDLASWQDALTLVARDDLFDAFADAVWAGRKLPIMLLWPAPRPTWRATFEFARAMVSDTDFPADWLANAVYNKVKENELLSVWLVTLFARAVDEYADRVAFDDVVEFLAGSLRSMFASDALDARTDAEIMTHVDNLFALFLRIEMQVAVTRQWTNTQLAKRMLAMMREVLLGSYEIEHHPVPLELALVGYYEFLDDHVASTASFGPLFVYGLQARRCVQSTMAS
jgi:hypothetical protein